MQRTSQIKEQWRHEKLDWFFYKFTLNYKKNSFTLISSDELFILINKMDKELFNDDIGVLRVPKIMKTFGSDGRDFN